MSRERMSPYVAPGIRQNDVYMVRAEPIEYYQKAVSKYLNIPVHQLSKKTRIREVVEARQIAMYLIKKHSRKSLKSIGEAFNRDHTTVIHAVKHVKDLMETEPSYRSKVEYLERTMYSDSTIAVFKVA